ncbi:hypothetical protein D3C71_1607670 [compost metagenome]
MFVHHLGFRRWLAVLVDQITRRDAQTFVVGHAGFTKRDTAGGKIQQQRFFILTGKNNAEGVGAETTVTAAERCHHRIAHHIDEMDRDKTGSRTLLGPVANAANVM